MDDIQSASRSAAGAASGPGSQGQPKSGTRRKARETKNANAYAGWQYDANSPSGQRDSFSDAQNVIEYIAKLAGRAFTGSAFDILNNAKTFLDNMAETAGNNENENIIGAGPGRGRKNKAKATGSSRKTASRWAMNLMTNVMTTNVANVLGSWLDFLLYFLYFNIATVLLS